MSRIFRWLEFILGIILGFSLALLISWWMVPNPRVISSPAALHPSFKDEYRLLVASAHGITGDMERARLRLLPLDELDVVKSLLDQAIRLQSGQAVSIIFPRAGMQVVQDLALLAQDLQTTPEPFTPSPLFAVPSSVIIPTRTWLPFNLISREPVCDSKEPDTLARIYVGDSSGQPLPGVQVIVTWEDGQEKFSTGLKPEKGLGYADFILTPGISYTVQLQPAYQAFSDISSPVCESDDGLTYPGSLVLIFQQP